MTQVLLFLGFSLLSVCGLIFILFIPPLLILKIWAKISKKYSDQN